MRDAVIQFDSVLAQKSSKWDLSELVKWIEKDFVSVATTQSNAFKQLEDYFHK